MPAKTTKQSEDVHNPYSYSEMDWAAQLDPAYTAARAEVRRLSVGEDGTLSVKVKELIVLGILASRGRSRTRGLRIIISPQNRVQCPQLNPFWRGQNPFAPG
jgi:hypothetical protein